MSKLRGPAVPRRKRAAPRAVESNPIISDAIIQAAIEAGEGDMVAYLKKQAETHPSAFMTLLGKVLPMQLNGGRAEPVNLQFTVNFVARDSDRKPSGEGETSAGNQ